MMRGQVALLAFIVVVAACIWPMADAKYGDKLNGVKEKDMMRKSIVFDKKTPDVFYCPMQKPSSMNKLIVRSRPLHKLCEYEGQPLPEEYKSDCYQDLDESDYACKEKYRIMMRKYPPGSDQPFNGTRLKRFLSMDGDLMHSMEKSTQSANFYDVVGKY